MPFAPTRRVLRITGAVAVSWYAVLAAFTLYPYCHPGWEPEGAVCYLGWTDYGWLYHQIYWASFLGLPIAVTVVAAWVTVEVVAWIGRRHAA